MERWLEVKGYEGIYSVSENGDIKNVITGRVLKQENTGNGYKRVTLSKNGKTKRFMAHRVVASAFVSNENKKPQVNHIDGNKKNNKFSNLEWVTASENVNHAYSSGITKPSFGSNHVHSKLNDVSVLTILTMLKSGFKQPFLAKHYGVHQSIISDIKRKKSWKHITKYVD